MTEDEITDEQWNILRVLRQHRRIPVREIHNELTELPESRFEVSPDYGEGWNDEREEVWDLKSELHNKGLITNDYQEWYLTKEGREILSRES
ncbi:hypothetical protein [Halobellus rubicundus]|uniref:ArsR family transcriptional regulator n=1 Tax=Halobellus rubicundus TaxID=2996466 RepID=A0ABD5MHU5_9EURY